MLFWFICIDLIANNCVNEEKEDTMSKNLFTKAYASIEKEFGFNFEELVKVAQQSPEKFEKERSKILTAYINTLPEEERALFCCSEKN